MNGAHRKLLTDKLMRRLVRCFGVAVWWSFYLGFHASADPARFPRLDFGSATSITLSCELRGLVLPYVQLTLNGHGPLAFLVDTGGEYVVVDTAVSRTAGLLPSATLTILDAIGTRETHTTTISNLNLGGLTVSDLPALIAPMDHNMRLGVKVDGILGLALWNRVVLELDYPRERIILHTPGRFTAPSGAVGLSLTPGDPFSLVQLSANGRAASILFDTGWEEALALNPAFARQIGLGDGDPSFALPARSFSGSSWRPTYRVTLTLGPWVIQEVVASQSGEGEEDGVLGGWILTTARWWLDLPGHRLWVSAPSGAVTLPAEHRAYLNGMKHWGRQDWRKAIDAFREAFRVRPAYLQARICIAYCLFMNKDYAAARDEARGILTVAPGSPTAKDIFEKSVRLLNELPTPP